MRAAIENVKRAEAQHAGLVLQKYAIAPVSGDGHDKAERRALLTDALQASRNGVTMYREAFQRWKSLLPPLSVSMSFRTDGRLLVGHGEASVLEVGLRLHHTYGQPLIPGSALKGLAAHYCDSVWGQRHLEDEAGAEAQGFRREGDSYRLIFGHTEDGGVIVFHDAWFDPNSESAGRGLELDVTTPHHPGWQTEPVRAPSDFDNPVPVSGLSVTGRFYVSLSWMGPAHPDALKWASLTMRLLMEALREWGVGGKTSSGYGRLVEDTTPGEVATVRAAPVAKNVKRASGTRVKVTIIGVRSNGGYVVQEEGRPRGVLNVGSMPEGVNPDPGQTVDVDMHDDAKVPQYRWPSMPKPTRRGRR